MTEVIIIGVAVLIIQFIGAIMMSSAAADKGYPDTASIVIKCFFLGVFGYLYALALPDTITQQRLRELNTKIDKLTEQLNENATNEANNTSNSVNSFKDELPPM